MHVCVPGVKSVQCVCVWIHIHVLSYALTLVLMHIYTPVYIRISTTYVYAFCKHTDNPSVVTA